MKRLGNTLGGRFGTSWAGGSNIHQVGGYNPPPLSVRDATAQWAQDYAPKAGRAHKAGA